MRILKNDGAIAKIWTDDLSAIESQALDQIKLMLTIPDLFRHIAIMPDTHLGAGAVIGSVVATKGVIYPNIVGVDIGCGMSALNTGKVLTEDLNKEFWNNWKGRVQRAVPVGFNSHKEVQSTTKTLERELKAKELLKHKDRAKQQIGTLGGGNHFLEVQKDQEDNIWFMVHSGSRYLGLQIANHYNKIAKELNQKYHAKTPQDLWFLRLDEESGQNYLHDMQWATDFALESRWRMLEAMVVQFDLGLENSRLSPVFMDIRKKGINIHHNFASLENHFGENVVVHRKGATQARLGQIGIIPGSMGTHSYIVEGRGNPDSYESCSHGAGRRMSRSQAKKDFTSEDLRKSLEGTFTKPSTNFIDEAPMAYKDINWVMKNQKDLIEIKHTLLPIITVKG